MIFVLVVSDCSLQVYKGMWYCKYSRMEKQWKGMNTELSVLNKRRKTNGIKQRKVAQGNPEVTGTWGNVRSDK